MLTETETQELRQFSARHPRLARQLIEILAKPKQKRKKPTKKTSPDKKKDNQKYYKKNKKKVMKQRKTREHAMNPLFTRQDVARIQAFASQHPETARKIQAMLARKLAYLDEDNIVVVGDGDIQAWHEAKEMIIESAVELEMNGHAPRRYDVVYDVSSAQDDEGLGWQEFSSTEQDPKLQLQWLEQYASEVDDSDLFEMIYNDDYYSQYRDDQARETWESLNMVDDLKELIRGQLAEGLSDLMGQEVDSESYAVEQAYALYEREFEDSINDFWYEILSYSGEVYVPRDWGGVAAASGTANKKLDDPVDWAKKNYDKIIKLVE